MKIKPTNTGVFLAQNIYDTRVHKGKFNPYWQTLFGYDPDDFLETFFKSQC